MNTELATKCVGESEGGGDLFMMLWPARYLLLMSADGRTRVVSELSWVEVDNIKVTAEPAQQEVYRQSQSGGIQTGSTLLYSRKHFDQ